MFEKSKIKMGSNRGFGVVFFVVFMVIAFWSFKGDFQQIKMIPFIISIIFLVLGLLNSKFLTPLNKLWFKFGLLLGAIIAPIVMGFIFFLVVTPIAFIMKLAGKDLLKRKYDKLSNTYWIKREKKIETMKQQF
jgi:hypothetical protein